MTILLQSCISRGSWHWILIVELFIRYTFKESYAGLYSASQASVAFDLSWFFSILTAVIRPLRKIQSPLKTKMYFIILFIGHKSFFISCYFLLTKSKPYAGWINFYYVKKFHIALNRQKKRGEGLETEILSSLFLFVCFCFSVFCKKYSV